MFYVLLTIIAILVYEIYKLQKKPKIKSKEEIAEDIRNEIEQKEEMLSEHIKTSILKEHLKTETALFENGKTNFTRLNERFKHDDIKHEQVIKDWLDYIEILRSIVYESELLDVSNTKEECNDHWDRQDKLIIRIKEIDKRFKDLLGNEYIDPYPKEVINEKKNT